MRLPPRSALFLPASNARAIEKLRALACDAAILDLEDAVGPDDKPRARDAAAAALAAGGFGGRIVVVRINAAGTPWHADDLAMVAAARPDAVLVPKVAAPADLAEVHAATALPLWAMVETCAAALRLDRLADVAGAVGLEALVAGTNDLAAEMRCVAGPDRLPLAATLSAIVIAARAASILALDGVYNAIDDADGFAAECAQGRRFGFDGKTLIHPAQIDAANRAFSPTDDEVAAARAIIAAFADPANRDRGAIRISAAMVERLHLADAERVLRAAERRAQPGVTSG